MNSKRKAGLDIVRTIAIVLVILIHTVGITDGYKIPIVGVEDFLKYICGECLMPVYHYF